MLHVTRLIVFRLPITLAKFLNKRHTLFNVVGTIVIIPFFIPAILPLATSFFPDYADAVTTNGVTTYPNASGPITSTSPKLSPAAKTPDFVTITTKQPIRAFLPMSPPAILKYCNTWELS